MYSLFYTETALKFLKKLDKKNRSRIMSALERCKIRPHSHIKKLVSTPYFVFRVGHFRVLMNVNKGKLIILVIHIGHRKNIYK